MRTIVVSTFTLLLLTSVVFSQGRESGENPNTVIEKQDADAARAAVEEKKQKELDAQSISMYKHNLKILNSRYSDFERRMFDQIAETDRRSFIVEAGLEIALVRAVNDGLLKRVELAPAANQRGEPTHYEYEVTDEGLDFVNRYVCGEDIS